MEGGATEVKMGKESGQDVQQALRKVRPMRHARRCAEASVRLRRKLIYPSRPPPTPHPPNAHKPL